MLDERQLTAREAQALTGVDVVEFSRFRKGKIGRFTIDRLMMILSKLGYQVDVTATVRLR